MVKPTLVVGKFKSFLSNRKGPSLINEVFLRKSQIACKPYIIEDYVG